MAVETSFGHWLQRRRKALDLTQEELAQRVGCAAETLRKIEADVRRPSRQIAERLAAALEIPEADRAAFIKAARAELAVDRLAHPTQDLPQIALFLPNTSSSDAVPFLFTQVTSTVQTKPTPSNQPITNLPEPLTTFIGREKEQSEVIGLMTKHRLVTLTGAGGVGKTRLAIKVASEMLESFPDGVCFLDLAPLSDAELLPHTLARLLELGESRELSSTNLLVNYFRSRTALVIFDNCEHLIETSAGLVYFLLASCKHLSILATSREALRVSGEIHYHMPPLDFPTPDTDLTLSEILSMDSVRLFDARAAAASPGFETGPSNASVVAEICQRLDGIPLAIELAAARADILTVEQILERLNNRFHLLRRGLRTALPRHQTLRAAIEWSYDLLTEPERILFRGLPVFSGGFTLQAAEAICCRQGLRQNEILDLLEHLVEKSLVNVEQVTSTGDTRYRLLEIVREYLMVLLQESGETAMLRDAHLEYFTQFAEEVGPHLFGHEQTLWFSRIEIEMDNLRAALDWSGLNISEDSSEVSSDPTIRSKLLQRIELCRRLGEVLNGQAKYAEAMDVYELMLSSAQEYGDPVAQSQALQGLAVSSEFQGDNVASLKFASQAEALARRADARLVLASALRIQGIARYRMGDLQLASLLGEQAFSLATEVRDRNETARSLVLLGGSTYLSGKLDLARGYWQIALSIFRELGNHRFGMNIMSNLGALADAQGDFEAAFRYYMDAWEIARGVGYRDGEIVFLCNKGGAQTELGDYAAAEADLLRTIEMAGKVNSWCLPIAYAYLAEAYLGQDKKKKALEAALRALALAKDSDTPEYIGVAWRVLGRISEQTEEPIDIKSKEMDQPTKLDAGNCFKISDQILGANGIKGERARTLREWARYELRSGDKELGVAMWYEARKIFEEIGARWEVERMATMPP